MKVENVERVKNNPDSFSNTTAEQNMTGKGQFLGSKAHFSQVTDIIDINSDEQLLQDVEDENTNKLYSSGEKVLYNEKGRKVDESQVYKNSNNNFAKNSSDSELNYGPSVKVTQGKNPYSKTAETTASGQYLGGREYGNKENINTFSNPRFGEVKNVFYNGQLNNSNQGEAQMSPQMQTKVQTQTEFKQQVMAEGTADISNSNAGIVIDQNAASVRNANIQADTENLGVFAKASNRIGNGSENQKSETMVNGLSYGRTVVTDMAEKADGYVGKGYKIDNRNASGDAETVNSSRYTYTQNKNSTDENTVMHRANAVGGKYEDIAAVQRQGKDIDASQEMRLVRNYGKNADAREINFGKGYENSAERVSENQEETVYSYDRKGRLDRGIGIDEVKGENDSFKETRRSEEHRNAENRDFISAQIAYQNIIQRSVVDIYSKSPGLEKLIALLFKIRKLTVKKIENDSGVGSYRSIDAEAELVLREVKNYIEKGDYKNGKAMEALNQFIDDQEKIKYCVGLSPFPVDVGDFMKFYNEVKAETEDIRSLLVRKRRNEMLRAVFRIVLLAFGTAVVYMIFFR